MFDNLSSSLPQHQSGALRVIAVCTPERSPHLPEVPIMSEAGLPGFTSFAWFGLVAPPKTPDDIVRQINKDVADVLNTDEVRERFLAQGGRAHRQHAPRDGVLPASGTCAVGRRHREGQTQVSGVGGALPCNECGLP